MKVTHQVVSVPIASLDDSPEGNVRISLPEIESLAADIKARGLLAPLLVQAVAGKDGRWQVVDGFRRVAAVKLLGWTEIPCVPVEGSQKDLALAQISANLSRVDLSTYELARACVALEEIHGWSGGRIAKEIQAMRGSCEGGTNYVNKLRKLVKNLPSAILVAWSEGHPQASVNKLEKVLSSRPEERDAVWAEFCGRPTDATAAGEAGAASIGGDKEDKPEKVKVERPSKKDINDAVKLLGDYEGPYAAGAAAALAWVLGNSKTLRLEGVTVVSGSQLDKLRAQEKAKAEARKEAESAEQRVVRLEKEIAEAREIAKAKLKAGEK